MANPRDRLVLGLIGATLIVLVGVLALIYQKVPYQVIPGGPKLVQLPDLIVDSIEYHGANPPYSPCIGVHTATFEVTVKIKNVGVTAAVLPTWKNWILVWSVIGGTDPPFKASVSGPPAQIASGQTATFKATVAGMANVITPDKSKSSLTFGVIVDPDHAIPESNEDNNFKDKETVYGGELCPPPK